MGLDRKGSEITKQSEVLNVMGNQTLNIQWIMPTNPWDEEECVNMSVILSGHLCEWVWIKEGQMWAYIANIMSMGQKIINRDPGKNKSILWFQGGGTCVWRYRAISNCIQVLRKNASCVFVAWHASKWVKEENEMILLE